MPGSLLSTATSKRRKSAVCLKREETNACMRRGEEEEEEVTDKSGPRWAGWFVRGTSAKSGVTTLRRISAPQTPNLSDPDYLPHSVAPSPRLASVSPRQSAGSSPYRCYCLEKSELLLFFFFFSCGFQSRYQTLCCGLIKTHWSLLPTELFQTLNTFV